jgi:hypothetical protein
MHDCACIRARRGQVVGFDLSFDLSAAFDTVSAEQLLPKLQLLGVSGRALAWFKSFLTGGSQQVSWDGTLSNLIGVRYGFRLGSILGSVLFLVLIGNMAKFLQIGDDENVVYADDTTIWQTGRTVAERVEKLTAKAAKFADWSRRLGLTMNASKTQLLLLANAGSCRPQGGENQMGKRTQPTRWWRWPIRQRT